MRTCMMCWRICRLFGSAAKAAPYVSAANAAPYASVVASRRAGLQARLIGAAKAAPYVLTASVLLLSVPAAAQSVTAKR